MKKLIMIITFCLFYLAGMAQQPAVDVVTLKNGSVIRGKILEQNGQVIKIYTTNRSMVEVKPDDVEKMNKEISSTAAQTQTPGATFDEDSFTAGNMIIGGSGSFVYYKDKGATDATIGLSIDPTFAYFVIDGLAIGARLPINVYKSGGDRMYSFGIGPIIKYYTDYLMIFKLEGGYEYYRYSSTDKAGSFSIKPGIGMSFLLNPKVSLEPAIYYEFNSVEKQSRNTIGIEIGLTIFL
jgi:hypothetical protein